MIGRVAIVLGLVLAAGLLSGGTAQAQSCYPADTDTCRSFMEQQRRQDLQRQQDILDQQQWQRQQALLDQQRADQDRFYQQLQDDQRAWQQRQDPSNCLRHNGASIWC